VKVYSIKIFRLKSMFIQLKL